MTLRCAGRSVTQPARREDGGTGRVPDPATPHLAHPEDRARICPYLMTAEHWRSVEPHRDQRCTAVEPPASLGLDKQRGLCLVAAHADCTTYAAAIAARTARLGPAAHVGRPIPTTAPLLLERDRRRLALPDSFDRRRGSQIGLIALMVLALGAVLIARLPGGGAPAAGAGGSPTPSASLAAAGVATPPPSAVSSATPGETPSGTPPDLGSPSASPSIGPGSTQTYRVKTGDTLSAIAARFGTTVRAIQQLNGIKDAHVIRVGQVLRIP